MIVLLIGLAVGVDYSLFYLKREREERKAGRSERAALEAAAATSGRSVLISGLTVMVAMAGMFFTGDKSFQSFGLATMMVVAVAVLGLADRPARAARAHRRQDPSRAHSVRPSAHSLGGVSRGLGSVLDRVLRRPGLVRCALRRACSSRWRCRRCTCTPRSRGSTRSPRTCP